MAEFVPIVEAQEKYGLSRAHIANLARKGKIASRKAGKIWLIDLDALKEHVEKMEELGPHKHDPTRK